MLVVDGALSLRALADEYGISLPRDSGFETLAGFALEQLGIIPRGGESFIFENRRYTVLELDGRRVARVRVERMAAPPALSVPKPA